MLNEQLANADQLTGPQLLEVIRRLKDIAQKMASFEKAAGSTSACKGAITDEGGGLIEIGKSADGSLFVACE